jgi:outer membrane protein OmpU
MKTLLLASTALVATAGIAAAEVSISGYAEIGVIGGDRYDSAPGADDAKAQYHTDVEVTFAMTGESDGGLAFGAIIQLDEIAGASNAQTQGGETYFLAYGPMRLDMGDTDGAYDAALQEVALAGASIADDETEHSGFNGNSGLDPVHGGQVARVSYSTGGLTLGLSANVADLEIGNDNPVWGLGVRYVTDLGGATVGFGLGYQTQEDFASLIGVSLDAKLANGFSAAINYAEADIDGQSDNGTFMGIGFGYTMNALSIGVNYGEYEDWAAKSDPDSSGFGLAMTYDLGGGLAAHVGYGSSDDVTVNDEESWSAGLSMSF